jgi:putative ABC transport system substrate-binding protein
MPFHRLKRREFVTLFGAAAAWPLAARAQQPAIPVVGLLHITAPGTFTQELRAFHQGLKETSYVEGENVRIEYRWADNQLDRLPELAAELARRQVTVIVVAGHDAIFAAKTATTTIPVVFLAADDPVRLGLVSSLARPGGNLTGFNILTSEMAAKRLGLLHELMPGAARFAALLNPANATTTQAMLRDLEPAARALGLQIQVINADTIDEINAAFATFMRDRPDALLVASGPFFSSRRVQLVQLAARHAIPAIYSGRQYPEVGGLMGYGPSLMDAYRQLGVYAGRILKGVKPADLPVVQSTKIELVINAQTAKMLDLTVPPTLLSIADDMIE